MGFIGSIKLTIRMQISSNLNAEGITVFGNFQSSISALIFEIGKVFMELIS